MVTGTRWSARGRGAVGWRARGVKGSFSRHTGEGYVLSEPKVGDYARAQASREPRAVRAAALLVLVETLGLSSAVSECRSVGVSG